MSTLAKSNKKAKIVLTGLSISQGYADGKAFIYKDILTRDFFSYNVEKGEVESEINRVREAFGIVLKDLHKMSRVVSTYMSKDSGAIFESHIEILRDKMLRSDLEEEIRRELANAEHVVKNVFRKWSAKFLHSESEITKARAEDIDDVCRRVLRVLLGFERNILERLPPNSIIIAQRLLPSDTVHLRRESAKGIITRYGSKNSHSAILARGLGIPAVVNPDKSLEMIKKGDSVLLDGDAGFIIVNPDKDDLISHRHKAVQSQKCIDFLRDKSGAPAVTKKGHRIMIYANASCPQEVKLAIKNGCEGIGLFRIEHFYLGSKTLPDEEELLTYLISVLKAAEGKNVTIRLLDVGGDKKMPHIRVEDELSHLLGLRGIRLLLEHKELLKKQIRVIMKLSREFAVQLLIPMITLPSEVIEVRDIVKECAKELKREGEKLRNTLLIGTMIETPAAVMNAEDIAKHSDFLSIGTNDLIQYTMAAGREDRHVAKYYEEGLKLAIRNIKEIVKIAQRYKIDCSVCGEMAGDVVWTEDLIKAGVRNISVSPSRIPQIKEKIRSLF